MSVNIEDFELIGKAELGILFQTDRRGLDESRYLAIDLEGDFVILVEFYPNVWVYSVLSPKEEII
jgi:hypothetical protein